MMIMLLLPILVEYTILNVNSQNISDLTGIEDFTALTSLVAINQLTSLDVSQNTALTDLSCNQIN